jgi:ATP-dependent exoDNAse (exonuclease V) beta subunit
MEILLELNKFNDILFNEELHQYKSKTKDIKYISATGLVSLVEEFNENKVAAKQADELNIDINDLLNSWKIEKNYASDLGSEVHKYAELSWQNKLYIGDIKIFEKWNNLGYDMLSDFKMRCMYYDQFYNIISKQFIAIRNELVVYDEYYGVAGMLDLLCYEPSTSNIYIFDWKSSKVIKKENQFNKMKFPLAKYDSCNFYAYSLQLSIYKAIIELNTTLRINKMCIIKISNNENCKTFICEDLTKEAIKLMEYNKNRK